MRIPSTSALLSLPLAFGLATPSLADDATLDFGVPAWPGITVKTEIASQLLTQLGYSTRTEELGMQVVYQGLESGDLDIFLGGWLPAQNNLYTPLKESGAITPLTNNVDGARMTLAVPEYLYEQGIQSFADLDAHRDEFSGEILGFGAGSAASEILHEARDNDTWGLGDWQLVDTSVVGMLSAARDAISRQEPVVWVGWTPHWMNLELDMRFLDDSKDLFGDNNGASQVLTVARSDYAKAHPNLVKFFDGFTFTAKEQSWMIREFAQKERALDAVAQEWLNTHPEQVRSMLEGVETRDGESAWAAVEGSLRQASAE